MPTPKYNYRRDLPHLQKDNRPVFITFNTRRRWIIPEDLRHVVLACFLSQHQRLYELHAAVIMPDHVHAILTVKVNAEGWPRPLSEIVKHIKGPAALVINRTLGRHGPVWQDERFDHVLRNSESLVEKIDYVINNPVRAGLASRPQQYPWVWRGTVPLI